MPKNSTKAFQSQYILPLNHQSEGHICLKQYQILSKVKFHPSTKFKNHWCDSERNMTKLSFVYRPTNKFVYRLTNRRTIVHDWYIWGYTQHTFSNIIPSIHFQISTLCHKSCNYASLDSHSRKRLLPVFEAESWY